LGIKDLPVANVGRHIQETAENALNVERLVISQGIAL